MSRWPFPPTAAPVVLVQDKPTTRMLASSQRDEHGIRGPATSPPACALAVLLRRSRVVPRERNRAESIGSTPPRAILQAGFASGRRVPLLTGPAGSNTALHVVRVGGLGCRTARQAPPARVPGGIGGPALRNSRSAAPREAN